MGLVGYDYLGLAHPLWPIKATIDITPAGSAIGFFDDAGFGDPVPNFRKLIECKNEDGTIKYPVYRVQMFYSTNPTHPLISTSQLQTRCQTYEAIAKKYPEATIYLSHTTEYTSKSKTEVDKRIKIIKTYAPHCIPVNNPWTGYATPGVLIETHDIKTARKGSNYLISTDGMSVTQMMMDEFNDKYKNAIVRFLWASRFNLRDASNPMPIPIKRTAAPTPDYLNAIVRLASPSGTAPKPTFSGRFVPIKEPLLWKAFAEDFPNNDPRGLKPLLICPSTAKLMSVVTFEGKEVTKIKFFGNYPPNLHRYYIGAYADMWGYEVAAKAKRMSDSEFVWIKDPGSNTVYGPVNPAFRKGVSRED